MKVQTTITVEMDTMEGVSERVREGSFRNKSHFFEYAAKKLMEDRD